MSASSPPPPRCSVAVVGGGIVGLAVARELTRRAGGGQVCVLERERRPGTHQTGHNSGVIHAGIYYAPGSLKAHLCLTGAAELYAYCAERGVPHRRCGKVIVALGPAELPRLHELERRGRANGVDGLHMLDSNGIEALEPHCAGIAGLHSPATGIVDFARLAECLADDVRAAGGVVAGGCEVLAVRSRARGLSLSHPQGVTEASHAIFCAGAWADRLAVMAGGDPDPRIVPFRGTYRALVPEREHLVRALVYPVPDPALPFLGVHLTRHIDGRVLIGPTALPALARDGYRLGAVRLRDLRDTLAWPGSWRMARRWWRTGLTELHQSALPAALARDAARYVPELRPADTERAFAGIRAQAVDRRGRLLDDFAFSHTPRALHVRNAPSPGATASLAIARHVADRAAATFGW